MPLAHDVTSALLELGATRDEILAVPEACIPARLSDDPVRGADPRRRARRVDHASAVSRLRRWDGDWAAQVAEVTASSRNGVLDLRTVELICIGLNAAATHLNGDALRHHIKAALDAGVSRGEIIEVFKVASTIGIHACNVGVPILDEELASRRAQR
jgi:alkylhydroperoxidase/carboxymuconolactone decarboxylase family protein YurZ